MKMRMLIVVILSGWLQFQAMAAECDKEIMKALIDAAKVTSHSELYERIREHYLLDQARNAGTESGVKVKAEYQKIGLDFSRNKSSHESLRNKLETNKESEVEISELVAYADQVNFREVISLFKLCYGKPTTESVDYKYTAIGKDQFAITLLQSPKSPRDPNVTIEEVNTYGVSVDLRKNPDRKSNFSRGVALDVPRQEIFWWNAGAEEGYIHIKTSHGDVGIPLVRVLAPHPNGNPIPTAVVRHARTSRAYLNPILAKIADSGVTVREIVTHDFETGDSFVVSKGEDKAAKEIATYMESIKAPQLISTPVQWNQLSIAETTSGGNLVERQAEVKQALEKASLLVEIGPAPITKVKVDAREYWSKEGFSVPDNSHAEARVSGTWSNDAKNFFGPGGIHHPDTANHVYIDDSAWVGALLYITGEWNWKQANIYGSEVGVWKEVAKGPAVLKFMMNDLKGRKVAGNIIPENSHQHNAGVLTVEIRVIPKSLPK